MLGLAMEVSVLQGTLVVSAQLARTRLEALALLALTRLEASVLQGTLAVSAQLARTLALVQPVTMTLPAPMDRTDA